MRRAESGAPEDDAAGISEIYYLPGGRPAPLMGSLSVASWTMEAESLEAAKNLIYYRQLVGLRFDKRRLASLERRSSSHYKAYLEGPGRAADSPRGLFLMSVTAVGTSATYEQLLKFYEARATKVVSREFKYGGSPVNWGSWRQFASSTDDSAARKKVFDDFVDKSSVLAPLVERRFERYRAVLEHYGTDPLSAYLEHEGISYDRLASLVRRTGELARVPFSKALDRYSSEILQRSAEYFDDFYFFRSRVFRRYAERAPTRERPISKIVGTMRRMGLDASRISVDDEDRKGKNASAFCSGIEIPTDVRISYRKANPFEDFAPVFHEFGHGVHFSSISPRARFSDRYGVANGIAEIFSIFFEGLVHERDYLTEELGVAEEAAEDIVQRFRFGSLYFAAFYAANSSLKLGYWHGRPDFGSLDDLYADLTERFLGIRYPGAYWKLHHVMPDYFLYSPSYLVAAVRAWELRNALVAKFGERYWDDGESGKFVLELMRPGQALDLSFSRLDEAAYVASLSGDAT